MLSLIGNEVTVEVTYPARYYDNGMDGQIRRSLRAAARPYGTAEDGAGTDGQTRDVTFTVDADRAVGLRAAFEEIVRPLGGEARVLR